MDLDVEPEEVDQMVPAYLDLCSRSSQEQVKAVLNLVAGMRQGAFFAGFAAVHGSGSGALPKARPISA